MPGARAAQLAGPLEHVRILREGRHGAPDEERRLRFKEVAVLLAGLAPGCPGHAKALQHGFRAEDPRRNRNGRDAVRPQLGGHLERESLECQLHGLTERIAAGHQGIVLGHLDDEAAARADHAGRGMPRGDYVRMERLPEDRLRVRQLRGPERSPLAHHRRRGLVKSITPSG